MVRWGDGWGWGAALTHLHRSGAAHGAGAQAGGVALAVGLVVRVLDVLFVDRLLVLAL